MLVQLNRMCVEFSNSAMHSIELDWHHLDSTMTQIDMDLTQE